MVRTTYKRAAPRSDEVRGKLAEQPRLKTGKIRRESRAVLEMNLNIKPIRLEQKKRRRSRQEKTVSNQQLSMWLSEHKPTTGLTEQDASPIEFGREIFTKHAVAATTYARVVKVFGERYLVDLIAVMGQHASEATMLAAFDQHLPVGQAPR
jgi:hypothetical protein